MSMKKPIKLKYDQVIRLFQSSSIVEFDACKLLYMYSIRMNDENIIGACDSCADTDIELRQRDYRFYLGPDGTLDCIPKNGATHHTAVFYPAPRAKNIGSSFYNQLTK